MLQDKIIVLEKKLTQWTQLSVLANATNQQLEAVQQLQVVLEKFKVQHLLKTTAANNIQQVKIVLDFNPNWILLLDKKGSTLQRNNVESHVLPIQLIVNDISLLKKGDKYRLVAYETTPKDKEGAVVKEVFVYDGSQQVMMNITTNKYDALEQEVELTKVELAEQEGKHTALSNKRKVLQRKINEKYKSLQELIKGNFEILINDYSRFCEQTLSYPSIDSSLDTQRKLIASTTSSFFQVIVTKGSATVIGKIKSVGIISASTELGTSIGGLHGMVAGFIAGVLLDVLINKFVDAYILEGTEALTYKERRKMVDEKLRACKVVWMQEIDTKMKQLFDELQAATTVTFSLKTVAEVDKKIKEVEGAKHNISILEKDAYYTELLKTWVLTNTGTDEDEASNDAIQEVWDDAVEDLWKNNHLRRGVKGPNTIKEDPSVRYQIDVYLYKMKAIMANSGMTCGFVESCVENHENNYLHIQALIEKHENQDSFKPEAFRESSTVEGDPINVADSERQSAAYVEFFKLLDKQPRYGVNGNSIKINHAGKFKEFFTKSVINSPESEVLDMILQNYIDLGRSFPLELKLNLIQGDDFSIFLDSLSWTIHQPDVANPNNSRQIHGLIFNK